MVVFEYYYFNMKPFRGENMSNTHDSEYVYSVLETKKTSELLFKTNTVIVEIENI